MHRFEQFSKSFSNRSILIDFKNPCNFPTDFTNAFTWKWQSSIKRKYREIPLRSLENVYMLYWSVNNGFTKKKESLSENSSLMELSYNLHSMLFKCHWWANPCQIIFVKSVAFTRYVNVFERLVILLHQMLALFSYVIATLLWIGLQVELLCSFFQRNFLLLIFLTRGWWTILLFFLVEFC